MPHHVPLISTLAVGLAFAFVAGLIATRLKLPALVGYLLAGVAVGPFTPGFVADEQLAPQLAEIGVILLMFGVGMHFSLRDLLAVRRIAIPGAIGQMLVATVLGVALAMVWGWSLMSGLVFGLALSVASTVVLLRALEARGIVNTATGRIAVGWLIVEDLAMVLALVLLPALAESNPAGDPLAMVIAFTLLKVAGFVALMLVVGTRLFPWALAFVDRTGSRELFSLAAVTLALGVAYGSAMLFHVSFALGAFFAGVVINESALSDRVAEESRPLQDLFGVLFFVSVGMLFDPMVLVRHPLEVLAVLAIIIVGKGVAAFVIVRLLGHPRETAVVVAASLAQIGEFSFILAGLGIALKLLSQQASDLILAGALLSITLNPLVFRFCNRQMDRTSAQRT
jgi:CPA2 family monovalent cation:H+ antiporter-2